METFASLEPAPLPSAIIKRDGRQAEFDVTKIASAIRRAGAASGELDDVRALELTRELAATLGARFAHHPPQVEEIQDRVELALIAAGFVRTARVHRVSRAACEAPA